MTLTTDTIMAKVIEADGLVTAGGRWDDDGPGAWWPIFPALWLLIIAGVITTIVVVSRRNRRTAGARAGEARLAELFAAGEITDEDYRHRLSILKEQQK